MMAMMTPMITMIRRRMINFHCEDGKGREEEITEEKIRVGKGREEYG
jgi:hypothetical protein